MAKPQTANLPLIPLARGTILLPGLVQRIPVSSNRPDVPALLAHVYEEELGNLPCASKVLLVFALTPILASVLILKPR
jgi:ATP-dependent Lon protease